MSNTWYSNQALNIDGGNHVYSTLYNPPGLGGGIPAGTYVAFEDLEFPNPGCPSCSSDYNYFDDTFVFTDSGQPLLTNPTATPLPVTLPLLAGGLGFGGYLAKRRKQRADQAIAAA